MKLKLILIFASLTTSLSASQINNGGFEQPAGLPANGLYGFYPGETNLTGWAIGGGNGGAVTYARGAAVSVAPIEGEYHVIFNGANSVVGMWIKQDFTTVVGNMYRLRFRVSRLGGGAGEVSMTAKVTALGGSQLASIKAAPAAQNYVTKTLTFTAASTSTTLEFVDTSLVSSGVDVLLDDIEVVPFIPSPLINGGFEQPAGLPANGLYGFYPGETNLTGWAIGGGNGGAVTYARGAAVSVGPIEGEYHVIFNGANSVSGMWIKQNFTTVVGNMYTLRFNVSRLGSGAGEVSMTAKVTALDGSQLASIKAAPAAQNYVTKTLTFAAASTSTTLEFVDTSLVSSGVDILLDDIEVVPFMPGPFINGGFEQPAGLEPNSLYGFFQEDTRLTGWTIGGTGGAVTYGNGAAVSVSPIEGQYHVIFNGDNSGSGTWIRQSFATVPGAAYLVMFKVSRLGQGIGEVSLTAKVTSSEGAQLALIKAAPAEEVYEVKTLIFTATSSWSALEFLDTSDETYAVDVMLDDVVVISIPSLTINRSGTSVIVSWPSEFTGFVLQSSPELIPTWAEATPDSWETNNNIVMATFPVTEQTKFFRLFHP